MKIIFKTIKFDRYGDECEEHQVLCNDEVQMSQRENIEPEDVFFRRDLSSPHYCKELLVKVIEAVKNGEAIKFENIIESDEE